MIRPLAQSDTDEAMALAEASGLFQPHELEALSDGLSDYFDGDPSRPHFWLTDDDGGLTSVAYCAPEPMTDGTWNLLFIAVRPDLRGQGRGTALLHRVEQTLTERGQRVLLVETSGADALEHTRTFYQKLNFGEEARIRDYYRAGDDKVIYRKLLTAQR